MRKLLLAAVIISLTAPAFGQHIPPAPTRRDRPLSDQQLLHIYQNKLKPLRAEILARQAAEGGELSAASHAEFQARLDRANEEFNRFLKKQEIYGYNAPGGRDS